MATVEVYLVVDPDGDYAVGKDNEAALEAYQSDIGETGVVPMRHIKLTLEVPLPAVMELSGTVPEEGGEVKLSVA